ncbi:MAG: uroporphyrinogen-III synthase [Deferribacteraceae bacterium]|jgi:uroporphyrinogen-III synthase|nr:uroporphyrinogen-III synthase [Deferribacteraceae bacterium]
MKRALITRAVEDACECVNIFSNLGLTPFVLPMIETAPLPKPEFNCKSYDYCIMTSPATVKYFEPFRLKFAIKSYAASGEVTAEKIASRYQVADILTPKESGFLGITDIFSAIPLKGVRVLSPGAAERAGDLNSFFLERGALYESVEIYETRAVKYGGNMINAFLSLNRIESVTFFSPSAVNAFMESSPKLNGVTSVALGKTTSESLKRYGIIPLIPPKQTAAGLAEYIRDIEPAS